jgi:hypothetical protein
MQFPTTSGAAPQDIELAAISQRIFQLAPTDQRQVTSFTGAVQPHAVTVLAGDETEAVVLDLVQPRLSARRAGL